MTIRPTYLIKKKGHVLARIHKKLFTFRDQFFIDVPGPDDITVIGRLNDLEYKFYRNGKKIAHTSKKFFSMRDSYGIEIDNEHDTILILAAAVVVDLCCHNPKKKK